VPSMAPNLWTRVTEVLLLGYLSMSRSFAYLGFPPLKLFIGELTLGAFVLVHPGKILSRWVTALVRPSPLSGVAWGFFLVAVYGLFEVLRGLDLGYRPVTALQNLAFNYYPLYIFLGLWVGMRQPALLLRSMRLLAIWNGIYGTTYVLLLYGIQVLIPGSPEVPVFGAPGGSALALLGLIAFERDLVKVWPWLLLNAFVMFGLQVRAEWLGFLVGLTVWGWLTKRLNRITVGGTVLVVLLGVMYLTDLNLPSPRGRSAGISVQEIVGRGLAPLSQELSARYSELADSYAGTVTWRTRWWGAIWDSVHADSTRMLIGHGYGMPLGDLVPYLEGEDIRTPHNVFYYALAYGGWMGVVAFFLFQSALGHMLWRAYRRTGQPFGLAYWAMALTESFFSNFFEAPFGAIPFYLLVGLAVAHASEELITGCVATPAGSVATHSDGELTESSRDRETARKRGASVRL
jgi:O-Antigen ligase